MTTSSSRPTIRGENLSKVYRLYQKPFFRFLDIFGLCPTGSRYYTEHSAVDRVDFQIAPGEKVAVIGRNGAGKSTLLRMICGLLRPTSGLLEVNGTVKALLDIGSGFYPDFTGRENALSALAYQGVVGRVAHEKLEEIIEFAELEEYIDQPMRTYSTGMMMRLMFSTATCVEPDILIADEVLGVGDAYFGQKSFERVKRLVQARRTTFLLVTHNIYSALEVCERFIWLDQGRIMLDGTGMDVIDAYEQSIKEQEERRQHRAKVRVVAPPLTARKPYGLTVRFVARDTHRPDGTLYLARLSAVWADGRRVDCALHATAAGAMFRVLPAGSIEATTHVGKSCLVLREYGDIFHKLDCWLSLTDGRGVPDHLEIEYAFDGTQAMVVSASADGAVFADIAPLEPTPMVAWRGIMADLSGLQDGLEATARPRTFGRYGTADVTIEDLRLLDDAGDPSHLFRHSRAMRIELDYLVRNRSGVGEMIAAVGMHRDGYVPIACFASPPFAPGTRRGTVTLSIDNLRLTNGEYMLGIALLRPNMVHSGLFFSMSPDVFDHQPRAVSFGVIGDEQLLSGWAYVQEAKWAVRPERG